MTIKLHLTPLRRIDLLDHDMPDLSDLGGVDLEPAAPIFRGGRGATTSLTPVSHHATPTLTPTRRSTSQVETFGTISSSSTMFAITLTGVTTHAMRKRSSANKSMTKNGAIPRPLFSRLSQLTPVTSLSPPLVLLSDLLLMPPFHESQQPLLLKLLIT